MKLLTNPRTGKVYQPRGPQDTPMFSCRVCDESRYFSLIMGQRVRCPMCRSESVTFCGWFGPPEPVLDALQEVLA